MFSLVGCTSLSLTENDNSLYDEFIDTQVVTTEDLFLSQYNEKIYDFYPYKLGAWGLPDYEGRTIQKVPKGTELKMLGHARRRQGIENIWQYLIGEIEDPENPREIVRFQFMIGLATNGPRDLPFDTKNKESNNNRSCRAEGRSSD